MNRPLNGPEFLILILLAFRTRSMDYMMCLLRWKFRCWGGVRARGLKGKLCLRRKYSDCPTSFRRQRCTRTGPIYRGFLGCLIACLPACLCCFLAKGLNNCTRKPASIGFTRHYFCGHAFCRSLSSKGPVPKLLAQLRS